MAFTPSDGLDLLVCTQKDLGRLRFNQIAQELPYYEVFSRWFRRDKVMFDSGYAIQRTLMTSFDSDSAGHVGYLEPDQVNIGDYLTTMTVPWVHFRTSWGVIFQTDMLMNRGRNMVLNVLQPKRTAALIGMVEELENKAFAAAPTTTNTTDPYSIQYWIPTSETTGFNGGAPSGHTTVGGVDPSTHTTFKNYTAGYDTVSKGDAIRKMRDAHRSIRFKSPVSVQDYRGKVGDRYRCYVNKSVIADFEDTGEAQNENLGRDIAEMDGSIAFRRNPIVWIPKLDARTDNPIYLINHGTFYPVCLKGDYLRESTPKESPNQHNTFQVHIDLTYNFICDNKRANAVIVKNA